jgi:hypothetical protein
MIAVFALEILPYGAVLNFGSPDGTITRYTYSYFSMTPFGYANFGPFLTALFSTVVLISSAALLISKKPLPKLNSTVLVCGMMALLFSLLPVIQDLSYVTSLGIIISALLLGAAVLLIPPRIMIRGQNR